MLAKLSLTAFGLIVSLGVAFGQPSAARGVSLESVALVSEQASDLDRDARADCTLQITVCQKAVASYSHLAGAGVPDVARAR